MNHQALQKLGFELGIGRRGCQMVRFLASSG
jgi:hypothetical protein